MQNQFIEAGKIVGTHGIKGEMKVESWMDSPEVLKKFKKLYLDEGKKDLGLISSRVHKNQVLITVEGVTDPSMADKYRGKVVYFDRNDAKLPKGKYFLRDLIGLEVYDADKGTFYGKIKDIIQAPANDVYVIVNGDKEYLFPAVKPMIKNTDIENGKVEIMPIPGIFDDDVIEDKDDEN